MKRVERIALSLRMRDGVHASDLKAFSQQTNEVIALELLEKSKGNFVLTRKGKALADSVAEAFVESARRTNMRSPQRTPLQALNRYRYQSCSRDRREWNANARGFPTPSD